MDRIVEDFVTQLQLDWKPKIHCSNCGNCIVYRDGFTNRMMAKCNSDYGDPVLLERIVSNNSKGWRKAIFCSDYDSMDDD